MVLILKFLGLAAILGPAIHFKPYFDEAYGRDFVFGVCAAPGLLMMLGMLFAPDEGKWERVIARLGLVGAAGHIFLILAMLAHIFTGHPTQSFGFTITSVLTTIPAVWLCVRNARGQALVGARIGTYLADDVLTVCICGGFVAACVFLAVTRPVLIREPEWLASGGIFGLTAMMMLWIRARNADVSRVEKILGFECPIYSNFFK